jgi:flagellar basal body rod protein FlgG
MVEEVLTGFEQSSIEETESPYDLAIAGDGFFTVQTDERNYLTRNGDFDIDGEGYLVLPGVGRVLGQNGEMRVGGSDWVMTSDGRVYDNQGQFVDNISVKMPADFENMQKFTNGMYVDDTAQEVEEPTVYQSSLERSNIDMNSEYTRAMQVQNTFTACSTALKIMNQMNQKSNSLCSVQ